MYVPVMTEPGWYPDPNGSGRLRWWDGQQWWPVPPSSRAMESASGCVLAFVIVLFVIAVGLMAFAVLDV